MYAEWLLLSLKHASFPLCCLQAAQSLPSHCLCAISSWLLFPEGLLGGVLDPKEVLLITVTFRYVAQSVVQFISHKQLFQVLQSPSYLLARACFFFRLLWGCWSRHSDVPCRRMGALVPRACLLALPRQLRAVVAGAALGSWGRLIL